MKEDYLVTIVTRQEVEGEKDVLEVTTHADLQGEGDDYIICYSETEDDGGESRTELHVVNDNSVTVKRQGSINTYMVIEKGVRNISHHVTPYGSFSMGVNALSIESDITGKGGKLRFRYATDIEMNPLGIIEFDITLTQKNRRTTDVKNSR